MLGVWCVCVCVLWVLCSALELFDSSAEAGQLLLTHPSSVLDGTDTTSPANSLSLSAYHSLSVTLSPSLTPSLSLSVCDETLHQTLVASCKAQGRRLSVRTSHTTHTHTHTPSSHEIHHCSMCGQVPRSQLHTRLCSLPVCPELYRTRIPHTRDMDRLLAVSGTTT